MEKVLVHSFLQMKVENFSSISSIIMGTDSECFIGNQSQMKSCICKPYGMTPFLHDRVIWIGVHTWAL